MGMLWIVLSPMLLTIIMSIVLGTAFGMPIVEYAPYILSGMIAWELLSSSVVAGGGTFFSAEQYIRQFNHPVTIYTLKSAIVYTINFLIATIGLMVWQLFINPANVAIGIVTLPLTTVLLFFLSWALTSIAAFTNAKYRDYPQLMALFMQALWYVSPVFFQESMFTSSPILYTFFKANPITHLLYLLRKPFLYGIMPSYDDYLFVLLLIVTVVLWALALNRKNKNSIIFYL